MPGDERPEGVDRLRRGRKDQHVLRMNINDAFKAFNLPFSVKVENTSLSGKGVACDLMVTFESFAGEAQVLPDVIVIQNLMDKKETERKIGEYLTGKISFKGKGPWKFYLNCQFYYYLHIQPAVHPAEPGGHAGPDFAEKAPAGYH